MLKDESLVSLAQRGNVAQFVSYTPTMEQRHSRVIGLEPDYHFADVWQAAQTMLERTPERSVNVRSYHPDQPKGHPFDYGLKSVPAVVETVRSRAQAGLYTIVSETVDIHDNGVSGVVMGNWIEFAPDDTPRCVEKPGVCSLPFKTGMALLELVYGFKPNITVPNSIRAEWSIHPLPRGYRGDHTILWEIESVTGLSGIKATTEWPNNFSRMVGDKTFGLLMAWYAGLRVPKTTVISRRLRPFTFGSNTPNPGVSWIRTSPMVQVPGKYTTQRGWADPFKLMQTEDPHGVALAAMLEQQEVSAKYSGACLSGADDSIIVEGVAGYGDGFMLGQAVEKLPNEVVSAVKRTYRKAFKAFGPVRFEWVHNGEEVWVVQFHRGKSASYGNVIYPGDAHTWVEYEVAQGLEGLRELIQKLQDSPVTTTTGIMLRGEIGISSHFGDVLRKACIPSRLERL